MPKASALHLYAVAIGSNRAGWGHHDPRDVVAMALDRLDCAPFERLVASRIHISHPVGPSRRRYANGAALVASPLGPDAMLAALKALERRAGRRRGRRWAARALDLDIILWSGGVHASAGRAGTALAIPHPAWRSRAFVLAPLAEIAAGWRDPLTGRTVVQLAARHARANPVDPPGAVD